MLDSITIKTSLALFIKHYYTWNCLSDNMPLPVHFGITLAAYALLFDLLHAHWRSSEANFCRISAYR